MPTVAWFVTGSLVATRLAVAMGFLPVLGLRNVPRLALILLVFVLTLVVTPAVASGPIPSTLSALIVGICGEVMMGVLIGGTLRLAFDSLALAGQLMDGQTGQASAVAYDPMLETTQGPLSMMAALFAGAIFVGADMHLRVLLIIADSFALVPPGAVSDPISGALPWFDLGGAMIQTGFRLAAPTVGLIFILNVFVAVITRLAPQLNLYFSFGFIITIFGGEFIWMTALPVVLSEHHAFVESAIALLPEVIGRAGGVYGR